MPSSYTTNLGIEKIATGEQSGTWGTTTNTNLDLIDEAVNGVITITLPGAGSSGSPNTLAISDGSSSDGRNKFIEFNDGGDLGGTAYVQLTPNDAEKIVHIRNSLTASRSIIIFQGTYNASNDFEIPNGSDVLLKFDGAGAGAVVTDVFTNLDVTGLSLGGTSVTATAAELNYNDITTLGTSEASKVVTADANGDITIAGANYNVVFDKSADALEFGDNAKAVFGAGDDLQIYHDVSDSYIDEAGQGNLNIRAFDTISFKQYSNNELMAQMSANGAVTLYYDSNAKIATTSTGIDVTGTAVTDGLTVAGTSLVQQTKEKMTISATAANGTINYDALTQAVLYYTTDASGNWTINVRGDGSNTLNSIMSTGEALTVVFLATQGSTAYYNSAFEVDGSSVTPNWQGGSAPTEGTASGIDAYTYNIIKTADAAFTVLASVVDFS
jgi:hypothetical protein